MLMAMRERIDQLNRAEAATVFADPVAYLAGLGVVSEVVAESPRAEAA